MAEPLTGERGTIITRTPLRISFAGGGTDLEAFYHHEPGVVLSCAVDRYVHVTVKRHSDIFNEPIRLNYSVSEQVDTVEELRNNIARACLQLLDIGPPIYISTVGDVPASTGMGGSSAFAVGLLHALHRLRGERVSAGQLADEACHIEIEVLGEPIGKQDQYAAAYGGLNEFTFRSDGRVSVLHQVGAPGQVARLFAGLQMFWTGHQRDASSVLTQQRASTHDKLAVLRKMRDQVSDLHQVLSGSEDPVRAFGEVLDEGWRLKRELAGGISTPEIDGYYDVARAAGAIGGKLCGAGGGGFLLFLVPRESQETVRRALTGLREMTVQPEAQGSQVAVPFGD